MKYGNWIKFKELTKKDKIFRLINLILMALLMLTCIGLSIYYATIGDPNNRVLASIGVAVLFVLPVILELIFRRRLSNFVFLCYTIYAILAGLIGCVFNMYNLVSWYDIFIHCLMGYLFGFVGLFLISKIDNYKKLKPLTIILFSFFLALSIELIWELMEWFADSCLGQSAQGKVIEGYNAPLVSDTNLDMLCNFSGALLFVIHFLIGKFTKCNLGVNYIENELCYKKFSSKNNCLQIKENEKTDAKGIQDAEGDKNQESDNVESKEDI